MTDPTLVGRPLTLRPATADDEPFLVKVYAGTRAAELAAVSWTEEKKAAFLQMQFAAQAQYYREHYPDTSFDVIVLDDQPVGRLYVARWTDEIRIVDIALLPESCNRGIGTTLVRELQAEAQASDRPLRITSSASIRAAALRAIGLPAGRGPGRLSVPRVAAWLAASGLNQNSRLPKPTGEGEKGGTILPFPFLLCSLTRGCR